MRRIPAAWSDVQWLTVDPVVLWEQRVSWEYHRLRCAGVSEEDRSDLLGHKSGSITTHYSAPEVGGLLKSVEKICERRPDTVLRVAPHTILTQSAHTI